MFKHILMPTDGSEASARALAKGAALAQALGATVTLVSALEPYALGLGGSSYKAEDQPGHEAARAAAQHWLDAGMAIVRQYAVEVHQRIEQERSVCHSILKAASTTGADLIVMGTHGAGALERLLVGSQTQKVLAQTQIPVLVLR